MTTIPNKGVIRYLGMFNQECLLLTSPKIMSEVLVTRSYDFVKPPEVAWFLARLLGRNGVLLAEGDQHKAQRRSLNPAFSFRHIKDLYPVLWDKSRECVRAMAGVVRRGGVEDPRGRFVMPEPPVMVVYTWASRATLNIIGTAGMGREFGSIRDRNNPLYKTYQTVFKPSGEAQLIDLLGSFLPGWMVELVPLKHNDDIRRAKALLDGVCADLIREKKARINTTTTGGSDEEKKKKNDGDILSVALASGGFATERKLTDQLLTFLAAGHETTASALTWCIYELAVNQDMQARLRAEVRARLPPLGNDDDDDRRQATSQNFDAMPYLHAVCSEVLRFHSPVPVIVRDAVRDTVIDGNHIPAGIRIIACVAATNRDVALWGPSAGRFDPERWLVDRKDATGGGGKRATASGGATSNFAFLTFNHGPRSCIGMGFARAELAVLLAAWVGRFEFVLEDASQSDERKVLSDGVATVGPTDGLRVRVREVEGW